MLTPATLKLDSYFYTDVSVSIDMEKYLIDERRELSEEDLTPDFVVHQDKDDGNELIISFKITNEESKDSALKISIGMIGRFVYTDGLLEKIEAGSVKEEAAVTTVLSVLYGCMRDQFFTITAKMPCGGMFLPAALFNVEKHSNQDEPPKKKRTTPKKAKAPIKHG